MPRCLIADDHPGVVHALRRLLADSGLEIVGAATRGPEAVELAAAEQPDCAVVDYRMPDLGGTELLAALRAVVPSAAIVVYTAEVSASLGADALAAGADAVVLKESTLEDVLRAIEAALGGTTYLDAKLAALGSVAPPLSISARERDVLALLTEGLDYAEIGRRLGIGSETCRTHLKHASLRLGAATRTEAVAKALRLGLIA